MNTRLTANFAALPLFDEQGNKSNLTLMDVISGKAGPVKSLGFVFVAESPKKAGGNKAPSTPFLAAAATSTKPAKAALLAPQNKTAFKVRKGTKVDSLMKMLTRENGVTFDELKKKFAWTDGAVGSYLYYYPDLIGYDLVKEEKPRGVVYKAVPRAGVTGIVYH